MVATMLSKKGQKDKDGNPVKVSKQRSLLALQTYLSWFIGPDEGKKLKFEDLFPLSELDPTGKQELANQQHKKELAKIEKNAVNEAEEQEGSRHRGPAEVSDEVGSGSDSDGGNRRRSNSSDEIEDGDDPVEKQDSNPQSGA